MSPQSPQQLRSGILLIAAAGMFDPNFGRSVVLLCEHQAKGSFGLVLNQRLDATMSDLIETCDWDSPVYRGGPVELGALHFIHCRDDIDVGSHEVLPGVFWGGDFVKLNRLLSEGVLTPEECRFFLGYSGWGEGQLQNELEHEGWYLCSASRELVFKQDSADFWRQTLKQMGPDYKILSTFPDDPRMN